MSTAKAVTIYHHPGCSKSRRALALLREHGVEPEVVEYLKTPPSARRVRELIGLLGCDPHELLRPAEAPHVELGLSRESGAKAIAGAVAQHPILMERPVVVAGGRAVIGRPPESVLDLL